jgi:hypothetical protein
MESLRAIPPSAALMSALATTLGVSLIEPDAVVIAAAIALALVVLNLRRWGHR